MTERVLELLARPCVLDALQRDDALETLNDISPLSDHYIPTLQYLMRPDNLVALVFSMLEEPPAQVKEPRRHRFEVSEPSYDEYAIVFRAHWVLCSSSFSSQLVSAMVGLRPLEGSTNAHYYSLCERLATYYSRDAMNLEALSRFLNLFMDQYSPEALIGFLGPIYEVRFVRSLLVLIHYEPIRDVLLRLCNELASTCAPLRGLTTQLLCQLAPERVVRESVDDDEILSHIQYDPPHVQFSRMIFTCDLLTDLIHEKRHGTLGHHVIHELHSSESHIAHLLDATVGDLATLPTQLANESYVVKVLNSLLQQTQCGCVSKIAFSAAFARHAEAASGDVPVDDSLLSPHVDLPLIWKRFIVRLPDLLRFLAIAPAHRYRSAHVQMIYLMLPILNVSCSAVDRHLITHKTMEALLDLLIRFPQANILHCAVSRLFIVALEDSPFMFGKELPAFRAANDPLRLHMLLNGCFDTVMNVYEPQMQAVADGRRVPSPPPAFVDIAISFDQAVTNAHAHSPQLFERSTMERWHAFRSQVLLPTQTQWEEQQGQVIAAASPAKVQAFVDGVSELFDPSDGIMVMPMPELLLPAIEPPASVITTSVGDASAPELPGAITPLSGGDELFSTPLSALYNDEEKHIMLRVASDKPVVATASRTASFVATQPFGGESVVD